MLSKHLSDSPHSSGTNCSVYLHSKRDTTTRQHTKVCRTLGAHPQPPPLGANPQPHRCCSISADRRRAVQLLSLRAMLAEQSLSWFDDSPNRATPAFPRRPEPLICQTGGREAESGPLSNSTEERGLGKERERKNSTIKKILLCLHLLACVAAEWGT